MKLTRYLIGLIGGATFGFLFAPRKGKELRDEILKKGKKSHADGARTLLSAFRGAGEELLVEARKLHGSEQVQDFLGQGEDRIQAILMAAQERGSDFASIAQEKLERLSEFASQKAKELSKIAHNEPSELHKKPIRKGKMMRKQS